MTSRYAKGRAWRYRRWGAVAIIVLFGHGLILWGLGLARPQPVERDRSPAATIVLWRVPSRHSLVRTRPTKPRGRIAKAIETKAPETKAPETKAAETKAQIAKTSGPAEGGEPSGAPAMSAPALVPDARRALTLALRDHEACASQVQAGRPIPARCHMSGLGDRVALGPKPDPDLEAAAARVDARLKYKTTPGNSDYWKRVGGAAIDRDLPLCSARPGTYSNAKDQRVWRCWAPDPRNGVAVP